MLLFTDRHFNGNTRDLSHAQATFHLAKSYKVNLFHVYKLKLRMFGVTSKVTGPTSVCCTKYYLKHRADISNQPISRNGNISLAPVFIQFYKTTLFYNYPMHNDDSKSFFAYNDTSFIRDKLYTLMTYKLKKGKILMSILNTEAAGSSENTDYNSCGKTAS
jgi:hypothetical protein